MVGVGGFVISFPSLHAPNTYISIIFPGRALLLSLRTGMVFWAVVSLLSPFSSLLFSTYFWLLTEREKKENTNGRGGDKKGDNEPIYKYNVAIPTKLMPLLQPHES